jgi:hypothetical protein
LFATEASQAQILVLEHSPYSWDNAGGNETLNANTGWAVIGHGTAAMGDSHHANSEVSVLNNTRKVIGGMDMDQDGKHEVIATSYAGRVLVYEMNTAANAFDVVWQSPITDSTGGAYSTRAVNVADMDQDGRHEIIFPAYVGPERVIGEVAQYGYQFYEWDGVVGSDNYGTTFSSINMIEYDSTGSRTRVENIEIDDVDGDDKPELINAVRDGTWRGMLISKLSGDIVHNSGGSFEVWSVEYKTINTEYGGGSPYHALPVDFNGDGKKEIINHHWNNFNFYNVSATGPDK